MIALLISADEAGRYSDVFLGLGIALALILVVHVVRNRLR